ncbi:MAG: 50S ribosomal protein L13 [Patescibacteria group bacterium]
MQTSSENKDWYIIDLKDRVLGRACTEIADILRGKNKPNFSNNADNGDYVVVLNADKFILTGRKEDQKRYYKHTGYLGNLKTFTVPELKKSKPGEILKHAVTGMLPSNKLRDQFLSRLKVYSGSEHPHQNIKFKNQG